MLSSDTIIIFNVSGKILSCLFKTILTNNYLTTLVKNNIESPIFIDDNSHFFEILLDYYRYGNIMYNDNIDFYNWKSFCSKYEIPVYTPTKIDIMNYMACINNSNFDWLNIRTLAPYYNNYINIIKNKWNIYIETETNKHLFIIDRFDINKRQLCGKFFDGFSTKYGNHEYTLDSKENILKPIDKSHISILIDILNNIDIQSEYRMKNQQKYYAILHYYIYFVLNKND
jgi:hypothetical protein